MWKNTDQPKNVAAYLTLEELVTKHFPFYPTVRHALLITLTLPSTTCTVECSLKHSAARKKMGTSHHGRESDKWIMLGERTPQRKNSDIKEFISQVMDNFASQPRRLLCVVSIFLCMISQFDLKKHDAADLKID